MGDLFADFHSNFSMSNNNSGSYSMQMRLIALGRLKYILRSC